MPSWKSSNRSPWIAIGKVARPHGVRGLVRVVPYDKAADSFARVAKVRVGDQELAVTTARRVTGGWLVEFSGVTTREAAEALRGAELAIARSEVPLGQGEYLVADLVGCEVVDVSGRALGPVQSIFWNGAHDVLVLSEDRMIPLVNDWVVAVDLEARRITVEGAIGF